MCWVFVAAGRAGSALLSDIYTGFNFQPGQGGAGFAPAGTLVERLGEGASHFAAFQGLRDASLQPWHQVRGAPSSPHANMTALSICLPST